MINNALCNHCIFLNGDGREEANKIFACCCRREQLLRKTYLNADIWATCFSWNVDRCCVWAILKNTKTKEGGKDQFIWLKAIEDYALASLLAMSLNLLFPNTQLRTDEDFIVYGMSRSLQHRTASWTKTHTNKPCWIQRDSCHSPKRSQVSVKSINKNYLLLSKCL